MARPAGVPLVALFALAVLSSCAVRGSDGFILRNSPSTNRSEPRGSAFKAFDAGDHVPAHGFLRPRLEFSSSFPSSEEEGEEGQSSHKAPRSAQRVVSLPPPASLGAQVLIKAEQAEQAEQADQPKETKESSKVKAEKEPSDPVAQVNSKKPVVANKFKTSAEPKNLKETRDAKIVDDSKVKKEQSEKNATDASKTPVVANKIKSSAQPQNVLHTRDVKVTDDSKQAKEPERQKESEKSGVSVASAPTIIRGVGQIKDGNIVYQIDLPPSAPVVIASAEVARSPPPSDSQQLPFSYDSYNPYAPDPHPYAHYRRSVSYPTYPYILLPYGPHNGSASNNSTQPHANRTDGILYRRSPRSWPAPWLFYRPRRYAHSPSWPSADVHSPGWGVYYYVDPWSPMLHSPYVYTPPYNPYQHSPPWLQDPYWNSRGEAASPHETEKNSGKTSDKERTLTARSHGTHHNGQRSSQHYGQLHSGLQQYAPPHYGPQYYGQPSPWYLPQGPPPPPPPPPQPPLEGVEPYTRVA